MKKKRLAVLAVALVLAFSGCGNPQGPAEEPQVELWSAYATDKIMRDVEYTERGPAVLSYEMAKNEVEGAQIIISPVDNYSVGSFTVEVSDLENEDGDGLRLPFSESVSFWCEKRVAAPSDYPS